MTERFVQLHLLLARHRGKIFLALLVFGVLAVGWGRRLKLNEDFTDVLPMSSPGIAEQVKALRHIHQTEQLYVDVAVAAPNSDQLTEAANRMSAALRDVPQLSGVRGEINLAAWRAAYTGLQPQLPWLMDADDLRELEPKLTTAALEKRLAWFKAAMIQPQGMIYKEVARRDPAGISDTVAVKLKALQAGSDAHLAGGYITSTNDCHALITATPAFRSSETGRSAALVAAVLQAARSVEAGFPAGTVKVSVTGAHRSALDNATLIRRDTTRTSAIATVAIAILIMAACRRRWLALLALLPVLFGAMGAVLAFLVAGSLVSAVALGCGSMLIGVAVDYGIYIVYLLDDAPPATREKLARTVASLFPALTFGALTTMAAFFVMFLSPVSGHRQLGWFGAVGVGLAALFALFVLPVFIPVQTTATAQPLPLTTLLQRFFDWRERNTRRILAGLLAGSLVCAWGACRVQFDGDLARLNGVTAETRQDEETIRQNWGQALSLTTIVVEGTSRDQARAKNEQVLAVLKQLSAQKAIAGFSSIAPLQPSAPTRAAHAQAWGAFWTPARWLALSNSLAAAGMKSGFCAEVFTPFLNQLAAPATNDVTNPEWEKLTADFWTERDGRVYVTTMVKVATEQFAALRTAVQAVVPDAMLLNKTALAGEITRIARHALPVFALLVAAVNALLLFLLLGRLELVLATLLPMAAGIFWTLGTLGLLGLPVDVANFVFVIFVVGVGGDYSLFLVLSELEPWRGRSHRLAATGGAVTMCALTAWLGTGVLVLARHPALFSVGLTALLGISYSLLATLLLVPPAIRWLARRNLHCPPIANPTPAQIRRAVSRLYRFQGPYVSQFAWWKMRADPLFAAVAQAVPLQAEILDLGCGYGLLAHWLTRYHPQRRVQGLDFDARKIQVAQATMPGNPRVDFAACELVEGGDFPRCDVVLLCDVLHYFPLELKAVLLQKTCQALRPGGRLILRDALAQADSAHRAVARSERWAVWLGQNRTRHGLHFADEKTHLTLLREAGFAEVKITVEGGLASNVLLMAIKPVNE